MSTRKPPHRRCTRSCEIVVGGKTGRENDSETILLWHRGLSTSDIALGAAMLAKAQRLGIGQKLRYA
jgi:ornithine cyclodeaminase